MTKNVDNTTEVLDSRDVITRRDELQTELDALEDVSARNMLHIGTELLALNAFIEQGSSEWRHGCTLIRESHFNNYAQELASELYGKEVDSARWPFNCIDWERAAHELLQDYNEADFNGITYYYNA